MLIEDARARQYISSQYLDARKALHRRFTPAGHDLWDFLWPLYRFEPQDRVLEVGCGPGDFWLGTQARLPDGIRLLLTDRSAGMVNRARISVQELSIERRFAVADLEDLPFSNAVCDVALAQFMLYHTRDKPRALGELRRVLRDGGWAGIVLTGEANMSRIAGVLTETIPEASIAKSDGKAFHADVAEPLVRSVFGSVSRYDYSYTMRVNEAHYIVDYARSIPAMQAANLTDEQWQRYSEVVSDEIRNTGAFQVMKACVLFVCR